MNTGFWKLRLVRRPYHDPASPLLTGFSARIEHDGTAWYFPLGENDSGRAAKRAREIYLAVLREGWAATCKAFPRELTVAMHWAANPVAWTYATLYTKIEPPLDPPASRESGKHWKGRVRVA
ncbi:MAG: hypothetical protein L0Z53_15980, partial [Acidobacteriales bacterium]|nr:hypothetical protein [Terriglobales bacterium]